MTNSIIATIAILVIFTYAMWVAEVNLTLQKFKAKTVLFFKSFFLNFCSATIINLVYLVTLLKPFVLLTGPYSGEGGLILVLAFGIIACQWGVSTYACSIVDLICYKGNPTKKKTLKLIVFCISNVSMLIFFAFFLKEHKFLSISIILFFILLVYAYKVLLWKYNFLTPTWQNNNDNKENSNLQS